MVYHVSLVRHGDKKILHEEDIDCRNFDTAHQMGLNWRLVQSLQKNSNSMVIVEWNEPVWRG